MKKLNVAVFFGGCSSEHSVSLQSASAILRNLNPETYHPIPVGITKEGDWFYATNGPQDMETDRWYQKNHGIPALLSPNRGDHGLLLLQQDGIRKLPVDVAFPVLHGKNGEDGTIQGLIQMAGIPLAGCGVLASALCMDKYRAHQMVKEAGICVPRAAVLHKGMDVSKIRPFSDEIGYPLFVKPVKAGSSFGISMVNEPRKLYDALAHAFQYDDEAMVEEKIDGFEVGCAVLGNDAPFMGEVDEIELSGGFFDFTEKYTLQTSAIHVPARIGRELAAQIKKTAGVIYQTLGCRGFARVDLFLKPDGGIVFNEVNTIPGFTEHSRFPAMMKAAGYSFAEILDRILKLALETK